jgi:multidrug resistance efflux pump
MAKVHYAKVEPYETTTLKSAVSAQVIKANIALEGKRVENKLIVELDDKLDKIKLASEKKAIKLIKSMIAINQNKLSAISKSLKRQEEYYNRINNISTVPKAQKDSAFYSFINTKSQYLGIKEKIVSLEKQKLDLLYSIDRLKNSISKKSIRIKNRFLDKLFVHKGDFVNMGTPLAVVKDLTRAKLVLFLENNELKDIKSKKIYIDGKKSNHKISKIWSVTDDKFISAYRAEIILKNPKEHFSKLLKVEFK